MVAFCIFYSQYINHRLYRVWALFKCLQELKQTLSTTKAGMQLLQKKYQEDFFHLGSQLRPYSCYVLVLQTSMFNQWLYNLSSFFFFFSHRQSCKWFSSRGYGIQKSAWRKPQTVQPSAGPERYLSLQKKKSLVSCLETSHLVIIREYTSVLSC